jgi:hypothetical protein
MNLGIDPKYSFWLGVIVSIELGIGQGVVPLTDMFPADWVHWIKGWSAGLAFIGTCIMTALAGVSSKSAGPLVKAIVVFAVLVAATLGLGTAHAADIGITRPSPAAIAAGYPSKRCGYYFGVGTGGNAGAVNGGVVGAQIVQGDLSGMLGYTCPFAADAFWFGEASFGFSNLNGSSNGLALSGPMLAIERFGVGSPINALLSNLLPSLNGLTPALPSIPLLPAGITTSPGNAYVFAGLVEQDIGAQIALLHGHQWVVAPLFGIGLLTRASNNVMIDTWAGIQTNSQSFCPGGGKDCARLGNMARIGVSLKY